MIGDYIQQIVHSFIHFIFIFPNNRNSKSKGPSDDRIDIVELLEAIAYLICQDDPITPNTFHKIFSNRGVPASIFRLADTNHDGAVSVGEMINFILHISNPRYGCNVYYYV